jgi:hypothetical protein
VAPATSRQIAEKTADGRIAKAPDIGGQSEWAERQQRDTGCAYRADYRRVASHGKLAGHGTNLVVPTTPRRVGPGRSTGGHADPAPCVRHHLRRRRIDSLGIGQMQPNA